MSPQLSPLAQLVADQAQTYSDVAREAYAQGKAEGERAAKAKAKAPRPTPWREGEHGLILDANDEPCADVGDDDVRAHIIRCINACDTLAKEQP